MYFSCISRLDDEWLPADSVPTSKTVRVCDLSEEAKASLGDTLFGTSSINSANDNRRKRKNGSSSKQPSLLPPPPPPVLF